MAYGSFGEGFASGMQAGSEVGQRAMNAYYGAYERNANAAVADQLRNPGTSTNTFTPDQLQQQYGVDADTANQIFQVAQNDPNKALQMVNALQSAKTSGVQQGTAIATGDTAGVTTAPVPMTSPASQAIPGAVAPTAGSPVMADTSGVGGVTGGTTGAGGPAAPPVAIPTTGGAGATVANAPIPAPGMTAGPLTQAIGEGAPTPPSVAAPAAAPPSAIPAGAPQAAGGVPAAGAPASGFNIGMVPEAYRDAFAQAMKDHPNVPPGVVASMIQQESSWNPNAVNKTTGATGIGQYMPDTAQRLGLDPHDAAASIEQTFADFDRRLQGGSSVTDAIKGHYGGDDRSQWGPNTAAYVGQVAQHYGQYGVDSSNLAARPATPTTAAAPAGGTTPQGPQRDVLNADNRIAERPFYGTGSTLKLNSDGSISIQHPNSTADGWRNAAQNFLRFGHMAEAGQAMDRYYEARADEVQQHVRDVMTSNLTDDQKVGALHNTTGLQIYKVGDGQYVSPELTGAPDANGQYRRLSMNDLGNYATALATKGGLMAYDQHQQQMATQRAQAYEATRRGDYYGAIIPSREDMAAARLAARGGAGTKPPEGNMGEWNKTDNTVPVRMPTEDGNDFVTRTMTTNPLGDGLASQQAVRQLADDKAELVKNPDPRVNGAGQFKIVPVIRGLQYDPRSNQTQVPRTAQGKYDTGAGELGYQLQVQQPDGTYQTVAIDPRADNNTIYRGAGAGRYPTLKAAQTAMDRVQKVTTPIPGLAPSSVGSVLGAIPAPEQQLY